jgi:aldehyde:ferredoxin oxidoreductase
MADNSVLADAVNAATGWDLTGEEAEIIGLRIVNLMRVYNFRCGHTRAMEAPSPRYGSAPVDGPAQGKTIVPVLDHMLDSYYEKMGWDIGTGKPLPATLEKLGLARVVKDIW